MMDVKLLWTRGRGESLVCGATSLFLVSVFLPKTKLIPGYLLA
jgi:hypothetical protein